MGLSSLGDRRGDKGFLATRLLKSPSLAVPLLYATKTFHPDKVKSDNLTPGDILSLYRPLELAALFGTMAMISLNLGILNLLPIPILDGGHIAILAIEGLARRDFSMRVKERMLMAGFAMLMVLMVTVIYNDLTRIAWIENLMPWR